MKGLMILTSAIGLICMTLLLVGLILAGESGCAFGASGCGAERFWNYAVLASPMLTFLFYLWIRNRLFQTWLLIVGGIVAHLPIAVWVVVVLRFSIDLIFVPFLLIVASIPYVIHVGSVIKSKKREGLLA